MFRVVLCALAVCVLAGCDSGEDGPPYPAPTGMEGLHGAVFYTHEVIRYEPTNRPPGTRLLVQVRGNWTEGEPYYRDGYGPETGLHVIGGGLPADSSVVVPHDTGYNTANLGVLMISGRERPPGQYYVLRFAYEGPKGVGEWGRPVIVLTRWLDSLPRVVVSIPITLPAESPVPTDRPVLSEPLGMAALVREAGVDPAHVRVAVPYRVRLADVYEAAHVDRFCFGFEGTYPRATLPPPSPTTTAPTSWCGPEYVGAGVGANFGAAVHPSYFWENTMENETTIRPDDRAALLDPAARFSFRYGMTTYDPSAGVFPVRMWLDVSMWIQETVPAPIPVYGDWSTVDQESQP